MATMQDKNPVLGLAQFFGQIANVFLVLFVLSVILSLIGAAVPINQRDLIVVVAFGLGVLSGIVVFRVFSETLQAFFDKSKNASALRRTVLSLLSVALVSAVVYLVIHPQIAADLMSKAGLI